MWSGKVAKIDLKCYQPFRTYKDFTCGFSCLRLIELLPPIFFLAVQDIELD